MLFEYALSYLPHCDTEITMPSGQIYQGKVTSGQFRLTEIINKVKNSPEVVSAVFQFYVLVKLWRRL